MTGYTRKVVKDIRFDGEVVTVEFRRLTRPELMQLQPFFYLDEHGRGQFRAEEQGRFLDTLAELLPRVLLGMDGPTMDGERLKYVWGETTPALAGRLIPEEAIEEVLTGAYFLPLQMELVTHLMLASSPPQDPTAAKKSGSTSSES